MKKIIVSALFAGLLLSGCSDEPKEPPKKEAHEQAIQAAADKAHEAIDKAAATSQSLAQKAEEIKDTARKAADEMSATIQKSNLQPPTKAPEPEPAPAQTHK